MPRLEENRYLPVFALLSVIITLQSFLIGEDRKQGDFDKPVISQHTPFVSPRAGAGAPRANAAQEPALALARAAESPSPDTNGPQTADTDADAGWVAYQAGQSSPGDDLDEPPVSPPPSPASASGPGDDTTPLDEETSTDEAEDAPVWPVAPGKDEWARPVPLGQIIEEATGAAREEHAHATAPRQAPEKPTTAPPSAVTTIEVDVGDNLWRIARRHNVSGEEILRVNRLTNGVLLPGQVLKIPLAVRNALPPGFEQTHVKEGETAIDVATRLGVPLIDLVRENDLASLYQIPAGTCLRYRKPGAPAAAPQAESAPVPQLSSNPEKSGLSMPVSGRVGDRFGWRKHPILGETLFHTGLDLRAPRGEPIRSASDGRVIYSGWLRGYGQTMVVRHAGGYTTRYAHCSALLKKRGDKVKRGERIAKVGSSGLSTGPHVHFEVRLLGKPVNPLKFLKRGARS